MGKEEEVHNENTYNLENDLAVSKKLLLEPRKFKVASVGVVELIKTLKPRKKGPVDKGKKKMNKI